MNRFHTKKSLGQHFLNDDQIALQIVNALELVLPESIVLEIGPGLGVLTKFLIEKYRNQFFISEIDDRILQIAFTKWQMEKNKILAGDFLLLDLYKLEVKNIYLIGNFPYNISSQIVFHLLKYKEVVEMAVGMFQREVAKRITAKHGNKEYGVISVLAQAYYSTEYLLEVTPDKFSPPPKVHSAVIRLQRKNQTEQWMEPVLRTIVKTAFNQRRKKLSNALSSVQGAIEILKKHNWEHLRAEQLSVEDYIQFTLELQHEKSFNNG